jgi:transposase
MRAKRTSPAKGTSPVLKGPVLDVLKSLLESGRSEEVVTLVEKLVARNSELEQRLAQVPSRGHKNEGVSTAQLRLFVDALSTESEGSEGTGPELAAANEKLREASEIDKHSDDKDTGKGKRQPPLRRPIPAGLRRVENSIVVPAEQRKCPQCGADRKCIGHDVTEVVELIPAEVVVRIDRREKLACASCEGELVRAPVGDKVVCGGRLGTRLVSTLLVDKYHDGLPLNRQKERFERMGLSLPISTLADQVTWSSDLLRPLWRLAVLEVLAAKVMHLDGTSLPVLDRDAPGGKRLGALWGYVGDKDVAAYLYASTAKSVARSLVSLAPRTCWPFAPGTLLPMPRGCLMPAFGATTSSSVVATCTDGGILPRRSTLATHGPRCPLLPTRSSTKSKPKSATLATKYAEIFARPRANPCGTRSARGVTRTSRTSRHRRSWARPFAI